MTERRIPPTNRTCRGRTVPNHAAANPLTAARSVAAVVTVAALILVGFSAWRQWSLTSALTQAAREGARVDALRLTNVVAVTQEAARRRR